MTAQLPLVVDYPGTEVYAQNFPVRRQEGRQFIPLRRSGAVRTCEAASGGQIWKSSTTSLRADLGRRSLYFCLGGSALALHSGATLLVTDPLPPITAPCPINPFPP